MRLNTSCGIVFSMLFTLALMGCEQLTLPSTIVQKSRTPLGQGMNQEPLQALYITNYSNFWHDYDAQQKALLDGISRFVNIEFSLVGKRPEDALNLMSQPHYSAGYDVVVYNMCFPDDDDLERINNIISQTRDLGVPAVLVHCTMHSFRSTSPNYPENQLKLLSAEYQWAEDHPGTDFPHWWKFTGIDTLDHDWAREIRAQRVDPEHPITAWLPDEFHTLKDELYQTLKVAESVTPLYTAYSRQSRRDHVVSWVHDVGAGKVFGTTLGHNHRSTEHPHFQQLLAHGIAYVTGALSEIGMPLPGYGGNERVDNYQATTSCQPSDIIDAASIADVQRAIRRAQDEKKALKVVSLKRSNSNSGFVCPQQGGILLNLWQMKEVVALDTDNETVTVQPGIRAVDLSRYLHDRGYAIRAMPDYTGVSIAGGIATAAHHSSLQIRSSMADMVESIKIIDGRGRLHEFSGDEVAPVAAHMGMLGTVVEITLAIEPQFKLEYGFEKGSDAGLEYNIESMVREHEYARVMWFAGNGRYVLDYYDRVDTQTSGTSKHNLWSSSGSIFRFVGDIPYRVLNGAPLRAQCDSALLRSRIWLPPFDAQASDSSAPVGWSHEMLGSRCEPGTCPWDNPSVKSRTMESAFPLRLLPQWMSDVRQIIAENRACFPILGIYLRFSKASDRWMGFNYGEDMVAFEIHIPKVANEASYERSADVYDEIMQMTLQQYNGRPHWGKNSSPMFVGIGPAQYPRWDDFIELKDRMDPDGLFNNKIWRQMTGTSAIPSYPGCVLSRDCICSKDSDCGTGYQCVPGGHYRAARVCRK